MADIDVASSIEVAWGTGSHRDETFRDRSVTVPAQLTWRDIHPQGVLVLPKGSPPAGVGEINWEDTLGGQFALALARLEGFLYAVYGSRPAAYSNGGGGWNKCQWYDRLHPRCLWAAEVWHPSALTGSGCTSGGFLNGECFEFDDIGEYAALGGTGGMGYPAPECPIRYRSDDPAAQFADGEHDRTIFPLGSVERDYLVAPFSPEGRGWFGATQPGRNDSPAWLTEANGYTRNLGQSVTIEWTLPDDVEIPTTMELHYQLRAPGGAWGAVTTVAMTPTGDVYAATIAAQDHGTECRWYIEYFWNDPDPDNDDVNRFEPGNLAVPAESAMYTFTWFTHFNPYFYGLPEMLDDYGGVDIRHGTDHFEFDGSETIQAELINLARWTISAVCGTTCINPDTGCDEGLDYGHPGQLHHNPRNRGGDHAECCAPAPIRFYWSGSNVHPHCVAGGKGEGIDPLDTRPLHNHPTTEALGSMTARMSWAGIENLFFETPLANPEYGGGASYSVPPFQQKLWFNTIEDAQVYSRWASPGLRDGHVIDPVHIQEIIDAVEYLVTNGAWGTDTIKSCKAKATGFQGYPCGTFQSTFTSGEPFKEPPEIHECRWQCGFYETREQLTPFNNCCGPSSFMAHDICTTYTFEKAFNFVNGACELEDDTLSEDTIDGSHCDDYDVPTWEECWNQESPCDAGKCGMSAAKSKDCVWAHPSHGRYTCHSSTEKLCIGCGVPATTCSSGSVACPGTTLNGCGWYSCSQTCEWGQWATFAIISCTEANSLGSTTPCAASATVQVEGFTYRYCSGPACRPGWDDDHGTTFRKRRFDHVWHPFLEEVATGPPGFEGSGNCYGDIVICGNLETGAYPTSWFEEVRKVTFEGMAEPWFAEDCWCTEGSGCPTVPALADPPSLPGIGVHDSDGTPLCQKKYRDGSGIGNRTNSTVCACSLGDWGPCNGEQAWVAIDLNLDGTGTPYANYSGRDLTDAPYSGPCIPRLRDYDLTKDPATWMHDCPCETLTGAAECEAA